MPIDAGARDGASLDDASLDGGSLDGASFDADPAAQAACMEAFGEIPGYTLCATDGSVCEFHVDVSPNTSCADLCNGVGHECVESYDSSGDMVCIREEAEACIEIHGTQICICAL